MTTACQNEVTELVHIGYVASTRGDVALAQGSFRAAIERDLFCVEAWLWLSRVSHCLTDRRAYLGRVLTLDPYNLEAQIGMASVLQLLELETSVAGPSRLIDAADQSSSVRITSLRAKLGYLASNVAGLCSAALLILDWLGRQTWFTSVLLERS